MRIASLDMARFFASISVVFYHYISRPSSEVFPNFSKVTDFGYLGVPFFFIISGYVIAQSANNRSALEFAASRFVRLYPALWASVIFTVVTIHALTDRKFEFLQILANLTLLNEYFGHADIDGVYWTLKAELKFYVCVFFLLLTGIFQKHKIWLSAWLFILILHTFTNQPFFMGWFITPAYSSFFIAGVGFYLVSNNGKNLFNMSVLLLSLAISSIKAYDQVSGFIQNPSDLQKLIAVIVIWIFYLFFYCLSTDRLTLKNRREYAAIGALTYPLYLIHNAAGTTIIDTLVPYVREELLICFTIAFMIIISWIINVAIENPIASPLKNFMLSKFSSDPKDKTPARIQE